MPRWDTILRDRVAMLKRGLMKAGYLSGAQEEQAENDASFRNLATSILTDLLHLGELDYQVTVDQGRGRERVGDQLSPGEVHQAVNHLLKEISVRAADNFMAERNLRR